MLAANHGCFLRFALGRKEEDLDGIDKQYLNIVGFLKSSEDQLALADGASEHRKDRSVTTDDVVFVHCLCENGNFAV